MLVNTQIKNKCRFGIDVKKEPLQCLRNAHVAPCPPQIVIMLGIISHHCTTSAVRGMAVSKTVVLGLFNIVGTRAVVLVIAGVGVLALLTDLGTVFPEEEGNQTARQTNECQECRCPLVAQPLIHLVREQHDCRTPEASDECLGRQRRCSLVLIRIDEVVVGRVVEENESKSDREATHSGTSPGKIGV